MALHKMIQAINHSEAMRTDILRDISIKSQACVSETDFCTNMLSAGFNTAKNFTKKIKLST
jgi:hypothetical protein